MEVRLRPTAEERVILERLPLPETIRAALQQEAFTLLRDDAEELRDALALELARCGFDPDYKLAPEGRLIEGIIDRLFMP